MNDLIECIYWMGDLGLLEDLVSSRSHKKRNLLSQLDCEQARDWIFENWYFIDKEKVKKIYNRCKSKKLDIYPELCKIE